MPDNPMDDAPVLRVRNLVTEYTVRTGAGLIQRRKPLRAVDDVSFDLGRGETLGLVGESGCGKSSLAKTLLRLVPASSGSITFEGTSLTDLSHKRMRSLRRDIQVIFQDPFTSLNPRMKVSRIISEPWEIFPDTVPADRREERVSELLHQVGLNAGDKDRFPHQFSGGQRQRIGIARALAVEPKLIVCDEPVSALDVSVQAQVVNLLQDIQKRLGLSYVFISHDLSVVRHIADRVAVMYLGKIVEIGDVDQVYDAPFHPYTQALISAVPDSERGREESTARRIILEGDVPSPLDPPSGCRFRTRCWKAVERCAVEQPELRVRPRTGHASACHFAEPAPILKGAR
ncbi:oligopeptide transport system ATP-binding protein [Spinactinospora alkalitolerans]|uniref:Oligopeptide transport system ATP-binding protein n=1 Tax=Spinactinospora alkalitolerans TaxID=687207 RepID=A0A852TYC0_9ACTN|nr:dipeptide ABC transporter ATP-binding protein [Spinactinospora alkalitolerans]NYE47982.1 oligopeptide transport system ATP-binding protein [Spinactinospora alkalitolerans]